MPLGSGGGGACAGVRVSATGPPSGRWRSRSTSAPLLAELARLPRLRPLLCALPLLPLASLEAAGPLRALPPPRGPGDMLVALSWKPEKPLLPDVPYLEGCGPNLQKVHNPYCSALRWHAGQD